MGIEDAREIYTHIYPRWDIAFDRIFGYTDAVGVLMISAPHMSVAISSGHVRVGNSHSVGWRAAQAKGVSYGRFEEPSCICIHRELWQCE